MTNTSKPDQNKPSSDTIDIQTSNQEQSKVVVNHNHNHSTKIKLRYIIPILLSLFLVCLVVVPGLYSYWYLSTFSQAAGVTNSEFINTVKAGFNQQQQQQSPVNFLILGIDEIPGQKEGSLLTDTIIFSSFDLTQDNMYLIPLPRDLWLEDYKTKINSLYYYGQQNPDTTGQDFASSIIGNILDQPIDYTVVVNLNSLKHVIDIIGGIEIDVPKSFTDEKFPREDVDVTTVTDPDLLYEIVHFSQGRQIMDGATALKYIRSRQSDDLSIGNDLSRNQRQQQLILAIIDKISSKQVLTNPNILGNLYKVYLQEIETNFAPQDAISLVLASQKRAPNIVNISIPVTEEDQTGLIYHPQLHQSQQWVFVPTSANWQELANFVKSRISAN